MAKKFSELAAKLSPDALDQARAQASLLLSEMPLHELRQARGLSQKMLAEVLNVQQPSISKMEKRTDINVLVAVKGDEVQLDGRHIVSCAGFGCTSFDFFFELA
jgi:DNA-binding XRE family transcriptional regulator